MVGDRARQVPLTQLQGAGCDAPTRSHLQARRAASSRPAEVLDPVAV